MSDVRALRAELHELRMVAKMYASGDPSPRQVRELRDDLENLKRRVDLALFEEQRGGMEVL